MDGTWTGTWTETVYTPTGSTISMIITVAGTSMTATVSGSTIDGTYQFTSGADGAGTITLTRS